MARCQEAGSGGWDPGLRTPRGCIVPQRFNGDFESDGQMLVTRLWRSGRCLGPGQVDGADFKIPFVIIGERQDILQLIMGG